MHETRISQRSSYCHSEKNTEGRDSSSICKRSREQVACARVTSAAKQGTARGTRAGRETGARLVHKGNRRNARGSASRTQEGHAHGVKEKDKREADPSQGEPRQAPAVARVTSQKIPAVIVTREAPEEWGSMAPCKM
eukprot:5526198-Pleurochrysis_carterae.AAC.2